MAHFYLKIKGLSLVDTKEYLMKYCSSMTSEILDKPILQKLGLCFIFMAFEFQSTLKKTFENFKSKSLLEIQEEEPYLQNHSIDHLMLNTLPQSTFISKKNYNKVNIPDQFLIQDKTEAYKNNKNKIKAMDKQLKQTNFDQFRNPINRKKNNNLQDPRTFFKNDSKSDINNADKNSVITAFSQIMKVNSINNNTSNLIKVFNNQRNRTTNSLRSVEVQHKIKKTSPGCLKKLNASFLSHQQPLTFNRRHQQINQKYKGFVNEIPVMDKISINFSNEENLLKSLKKEEYVNESYSAAEEFVTIWKRNDGTMSINQLRLFGGNRFCEDDLKEFFWHFGNIVFSK